MTRRGAQTAPSSTSAQPDDVPVTLRTDPPHVGRLRCGPRNSLCDVAGVRVAHETLDLGAVQTGVTVVLPADGPLFMRKLPAACSVINGFGKSAGLVQVREVGTLESPIALCSTLAVGAALHGLTRWSVQQEPRIARELSSVNAIALECNDGYLNDAHAFAVEPALVQRCVERANEDEAELQDLHAAGFARGSVGAGRGMTCFGLKGGIGTASRITAQSTALGRGATDHAAVERGTDESGTDVVGAGEYTVGALVLANFGRPEMLRLAGHGVGAAMLAARERALRKLWQQKPSETTVDGPERGSIIVLLATDAPLDARQLQRLSLRAAAGIARTGSDYGHGSGDIALAWSTATRIPELATEPMPSVQTLHESRLDELFAAAAEATEQAIVDALYSATTVQGRDGHTRVAWRDLWP